MLGGSKSETGCSEGFLEMSQKTTGFISAQKFGTSCVELTVLPIDSLVSLFGLCKTQLMYMFDTKDLVFDKE